MLTCLLSSLSTCLLLLSDEEYLRPVREEGGVKLCHYWYFPDSYDTRVKADNVSSKIETPPVRGQSCIGIDTPMLLQLILLPFLPPPLSP